MNKIALGAEQSMSWSQLKDIPNNIIDMKNNNIEFVYVEQHASSIPFDTYVPQKEALEIVLAMGEETKGFTNELLQYADTIVEIPMRGKKESLNVSVAFGVAVYSVFKNIK
jgi:tRNA G18 (ribose-2'-O)-methylase SpoU